MEKTLRPNIISPFVGPYIKSLFAPTPMWAHLYVTRHCNFNCKYCGARDNYRQDPTYENLCQYVLKLKSLGCGLIGFMGGEPTLRPDFVKIVEFCSKNKMYTQLPTNGMFLINPLRTVKGKTLLEQLVSAGLCVLNLSVDSVVSGFKASEKELPKTQAILNALIEQKEKRGLVIMLNCVITKKNIMQVPQMLEFCHSKSLSMAAIFAQDPNPSNSPQMVRVPKGILFSKSDYSEVEKTVDYLISKKKSGYQLIEPIEYYASVKDWINGRLNWQCEGGLSSLNIDTDGKVGICGYLPYIGVNIKDSKEVIYRAVNRAREKYLTWCTQKCIPSCMYCSAYFRHHPLSLLYNKIRYL